MVRGTLPQPRDLSGTGGLPQSVGEGLQIRRRHLPHWQAGGSWYFVTFRLARGPLPAEARRAVMDVLMGGDGARYELVAAVVMPDHVHCVLHPLERAPGAWLDLGRLLKTLKGVSARRVNEVLSTRGTVWQDESWDRVIRSEPELWARVEYIRTNPVRAGLVSEAEEYPLLLMPGTEVGGDRQDCRSHGRR